MKTFRCLCMALALLVAVPALAQKVAAAPAGLIPCQHCKKEYSPGHSWHKCDRCDFRICPLCINAHQGKYGQGGQKCSQCAHGQLRGPGQQAAGTLVAANIPCQAGCGQELPVESFWYRCNTCGFRLCSQCLHKHQGKYGQGGYKCSQCMNGRIGRGKGRGR